MVTFSPELNLMLNNFAELEEIKERGGKESLAYQHLVESLEQSEVLLRATEQAIEEDKLNHFNLIAEHKAGAASYAAKSKTVNFKLSTLEDTQHKADIVFIFGHEVGHANNYYLSQSLREGFESKAEALSQQEGIRDYTSLVQEVLEDHARDEGLSQFAGWNALVSNLRKDNPNLTRQDIYATEGNFKLRFFNDDGQLKDGYQINANLSFDLTSENMAAVKEHFFETIRNTSGVKDAGYRDMYSRDYIERYIPELEDKYKTIGAPTLDMEKLGLSPQRSLEIKEAIETLKTPEQARELEQEKTLEKSAPKVKADNGFEATGVEYEPIGNQYFDAIAAARTIGDEEAWYAALEAYEQTEEGIAFKELCDMHYAEQEMLREQEMQAQQELQRQQEQEQLEQQAYAHQLQLEKTQANLQKQQEFGGRSIAGPSIG